MKSSIRDIYLEKNIILKSFKRPFGGLYKALTIVFLILSETISAESD